MKIWRLRIVEELKTYSFFETFKRFQTSHGELSVGLADRVEETMSERVSAPPPDLATYPSIASSPKNQVKTVGLLVSR